jgi:hypothetical protein
MTVCLNFSESDLGTIGENHFYELGVLRQDDAMPTLANRIRHYQIDLYRYCCASRLKITLFGHCASKTVIFVGLASETPIVRSGTHTSKKCSPA